MADSMKKYAEILHEQMRCDFFGTCPKYKANLSIERARIEEAHPSWVGNPAVEALRKAHHDAHKYGTKKGSPKKELKAVPAEATV